MKLTIVSDRLEIRLNRWEQLWSAHPGRTMSIPIQNILDAIPDVSTMHWDEWRAPGTYLPGIIKAGTFFSKAGCEFWYITPRSEHLTLNLKDEWFKRIVLNVDNSANWVAQINQARALNGQPA